MRRLLILFLCMPYLGFSQLKVAILDFENTSGVDKYDGLEAEYLNKEAQEQTISYNATLMFSEALYLIDNLEMEEAIKKLDLILNEFPDFSPAQEEIKKLKLDS